MDYIAASMVLRVWAPLARRHSLHRHLRLNRNPERQRNFGIEPLVDDDLHRYALNDLDEVAGGVFGWEGRELRTGPELDAVDMALQPQLRIGIDTNIDVLAGSHVDELALLEVGGNPDVGRDDRKDLLAGGDVIALFHVAFGDPAVLRRLDHGPGQIQIRLIEPCLRLLDLALELADSGIGLTDAFGDRGILCHLGIG